jgi:hypothetical protein
MPVSPAAPASEPPHDTPSVAAPPPVAPSDEPDLPWFDRPAEPKPAVAPIAAAEPHAEAAPREPPLSAAPTAYEEPRDQGPGTDDDLFERRDPPPLHAPGAPEEEHGLQTSAYRDEYRESPRTPDHVPDWAWPSALDREPEAAPAPRAELGPPPEPLVTPEPVVRPEPERPAPNEPAAAAGPPAARTLDPDATRALGNIRRLMLVSNLFMVVAIGAVLAVVGYRIYRTEPAPPPPPVAAPAPAKIPVDMTLTLPRGARIVGTAIAGDRLVITLQIDGATEIRTFDIKTLQPAGRLNFATVP